MIERKKLHNLVQELKGNIRVYMRCAACLFDPLCCVLCCVLYCAVCSDLVIVSL